MKFVTILRLSKLFLAATSPTYDSQLLRLPARDRAGVQVGDDSSIKYSMQEIEKHYDLIIKAILERQRLRSASISSADPPGSHISTLDSRAARFSRSHTTK